MRMSPKQAMNLDVSTASKAELTKAESVLFKVLMTVRGGSPIQKEVNVKYWEVRKALGFRANPGKPKQNEWIPAHAVRIRRVGKQTLVDILK